MIDKITSWIKNYCTENEIESLIVGISGGIDSSVVSTLCALTNLEVYAVSMPINQIKSQHDLSLDHGKWLTENYNAYIGMNFASIHYLIALIGIMFIIYFSKFRKEIFSK